MVRIHITFFFIDFEEAYDSIDRRGLYAAMVEMNVPRKLIALVKATMKTTHCRVKIQNRLSEPITYLLTYLLHAAESFFRS